MEAELKVGDKVCFRNTEIAEQRNAVYRIVSVNVARPSRKQKDASHDTGNNLYGREPEKLSLPQASYELEPLRGGKRITALQGEIDLVTSETTHSTQ